MNWILIIELIVILMLLATSYFFFRKDKGLFQKLIGNFVYGLMLQAETYLKSKKGEEKLDLVLELYDKKLNNLPPISRMIMKAFLPKKKLNGYISKLLPTLNDIFRPIYQAESSSLKELAKQVKDKVIEEAINIDLNGDKNLISNNQLLTLSEDYNLSIETKGIIEGYAKIESDFRNNHNLEAGIKGMYRFKKREGYPLFCS